MGRHLRRMWSQDQGEDLVEYVLITLLVSVALIAALNTLSGGVSTLFSEAISAMQ
ncbi:MAG TPA: hypothetical protein VE734_07240 [Terriglobales bacterium]|nr:hypothetical protein [Terriglobales bacterium]